MLTEGLWICARGLYENHAYMLIEGLLICFGWLSEKHKCGLKDCEYIS